MQGQELVTASNTASKSRPACIAWDHTSAQPPQAGWIRRCHPAHTILLIPSCSYHPAHTILLILSCSYHPAHTILLIPSCSYLT
eukprot:352869-Chlamydomonas_euryale.AAC.8